MRMRGLAALCGLVFLAGCSSVDLTAPIEDRSTPAPDVTAPVEDTQAHAVPVPTDGTFAPRHLTGVNPRELMLLNNISDPTQLSIGLELQIPVSREDGSAAVTAPAATVTEGELIAPAQAAQAPATDPTVEVAKRPETPEQVAERKIAEQEQRQQAAARGEIEIRWPVEGEVIADFNRTGTLGIDIGANKGDPVMSVLDGTVHYIGNNNDGYGQFVLVRHNIRLPGKPTAPVVTVYANLSRVLVKLNESVRAGQKIAEVGESQGVEKLRFELRQGGQPLDPMLYLRKK